MRRYNFSFPTIIVGLFCLVFISLISIVFSSPAQALQTIPYKVNFQGRLTDATGNIKPDGQYNMKLSLFSATSGGTAVWSETRATTSRVQLTNGLFSIQLGDLTALSPSLFTTQPLYLEIELPTPATATCSTTGCATWTEGAMTPRSPLGSSPYAFNADTLDGYDSSNFIIASQNNTFTGSNTFNNTANSTAAFQIQDASGANLFTVDTTNKRLSINGPSLTYLQGSSSGALAFASQVSYNTDINPQSIAAADFNGDGKPDIVTGNVTANTVSVLMNNGNGTFAPTVNYTVGSTPQGATAADLNGDGNVDIITANYNNNTVSALLNNGSGTFATAVAYPTGANPESVKTADVNGDGKLDIITANTGPNTMSVLMNNGSGTFAAPVSYATGNRPLLVAAGDFNGDGKPDIATTDTNDNTISVFINNGSGTFATRVAYSAGSSPDSITTGDFNSDGKIDLAVANYNNSTSILMGNGNGTFAPRVDYTAGVNPQSVAAADFNGDGKPDVVLANLGGTTASVLLNNGDGTLGAPTNFTIQNAPYAITTADLNGDGRPDIIAPSNNNVVAVLLNTTSSVIGASASANLSISSTSPTSAGLIIQGASGQSADLLHLQDSNGNLIQSTSATGAATFKNITNSTVAFKIQNAIGTNLFVADTTNNALKVGGGDISPDGSPTLLVIDSSTASGDPAGFNGAMYYNQVSNKFRCFQGGAWMDCISSGASSTGARTTFDYQNDFFLNTATNVMASNVSGASAANTQQSGESSHPGLIRMTTGTTSTGRAGYISGTNNMLFGSGVTWTATAGLRVNALSDATDTYIMRFGFGDSATADGVDGCFFRYSNGINSGKWQGVCRKANVESVCDTGLSITAGTWYNLKIGVSNDTSSANFVANDTSLCTVTTNIPTTTSTVFGLVATMVKTVGTNNTKSIDLDYLEYRGDGFGR